VERIESVSPMGCRRFSIFGNEVHCTLTLLKCTCSHQNEMTTLSIRSDESGVTELKLSDKSVRYYDSTPDITWSLRNDAEQPAREIVFELLEERYILMTTYVLRCTLTDRSGALHLHQYHFCSRLQVVSTAVHQRADVSTSVGLYLIYF
jgi:hypothetical protein